MFIWDFVASNVMSELLDWAYGQIVGFLGNFFGIMGNMGVELFELSWVQAVVLFFDRLGLGLMLSAGEVPRIAGAFGLDTSAKVNLSSAIYTAQSAVNTTRTILQAAHAT